MALITCENASFGYEGNIAVNGLNFKVDGGDYLCIVGENGSGKSTLMKGLLHLKTPADGKVFTGDGLCSNEIGYLPQQTPTQKDFPASVYEVVLSGRLGTRGILPFYTKKDRQIAKENIKKLGIEHLQNRCYRELSGGQQQRVLLARALCATKKLLLLDEPVSGLDPVVTQELYKLIHEINKSGLTIIMVSHDILSAVKYASHILHLDGKQKFFGKISEYINTGFATEFLKGVKNTNLGKPRIFKLSKHKTDKN